MKLLRLILALLVAGGAFFSGGAAGRVKKGVTVDGVEVGGMRYEEAALLVRERRLADLPPFTVHTPAGERTFPLDYSDDLLSVLRQAARGEDVHATFRAEWVNAEEALSALCGEFVRPPKDAALSFSAAGFSYEAEEDGVACDEDGLLSDVWEALRTGGTEATLRTFPFKPGTTLAALRERTRPLAVFSTVFDASKTSRAANIALAAKRISGTEIPPRGEFSFNAAVGKRTRENGFSEAPVISGGEYVQGVGGGVCQASSTLMNAALAAGMKITESHPHSLSVSYVPPSLDAMVSEYSDLRFVNPYEFPVYILGGTEEGRVQFSLYGKRDGRTYRTESKVLLRVDPPPEKIVEGEEDRWLRAAKQGIASESWLLVYEGEKLLSRTLIRRDVYAVVQGVREQKSEPPAGGPESGGDEFTSGQAAFFGVGSAAEGSPAPLL